MFSGIFYHLSMNLILRFHIFQDDANNDPQWSVEQILAAEFKCGDTVIGQQEIDIMNKTTVCVFEILERAWAGLDCSLIDMKIEFGVCAKTGMFD